MANAASPQLYSRLFPRRGQPAGHVGVQMPRTVVVGGISTRTDTNYRGPFGPGCISYAAAALSSLTGRRTILMRPLAEAWRHGAGGGGSTGGARRAGRRERPSLARPVQCGAARRLPCEPFDPGGLSPNAAPAAFFMRPLDERPSSPPPPAASTSGPEVHWPLRGESDLRLHMHVVQSIAAGTMQEQASLSVVSRIRAGAFPAVRIFQATACQEGLSVHTASLALRGENGPSHQNVSSMGLDSPSRSERPLSSSRSRRTGEACRGLGVEEGGGPVQLPGCPSWGYSWSRPCASKRCESVPSPSGAAAVTGEPVGGVSSV